MPSLPSAAGTRSNPGGTGAPLASFRTLPGQRETRGMLSPPFARGRDQSRSAIAISAFSSVSVSSGRPTVMRMQSASAPPP